MLNEAFLILNYQLAKLAHAGAGSAPPKPSWGEPWILLYNYNFIDCSTVAGAGCGWSSAGGAHQDAQCSVEGGQEQD